MIDNKFKNAIIKQLDTLVVSYEKSIKKVKALKKKMTSGYKPEKNYMRKTKVKK